MTRYLPREEARPDGAETPVSALVTQMSQDLARLVRQEVELAKAEMRQEATKAGTAVGMLAGGGIAAHWTVVFLSLALMWALGEVMALGWAALIVAAIWGLIAAALLITGRGRLRAVRAVPVRTIESVKEDLRWAKTRAS